MTTTEKAAEIRRVLKAAGWSSRDVSVKASYFANGSAIDIRIKNPACPIKMVEEIANRHESIRRCEMSGEILSGGNTYVSVSYTREAMDVISARFTDRVKAAVEKLGTDRNGLERVGETEFLIGFVDGYTLSVWDKSAGCLGRMYGVKGAAELIGTLAVARGIA